MNSFISSVILLLTLINPFLVVIYLTDPLQKLKPSQFQKILFRAGLIAVAVFCGFAILGDAIFTRFLHLEFASFQIFGGIVFLLIGIKFVFYGPTAIEILRGESEHIAGAIAMPVLIGPGSISASVVVGKHHAPLMACLVVLVAVATCLLTIFILKAIHDSLRPRKEILIKRYIEIAGRITAFFVGTVAIDMIFRGLRIWLTKL